MAPRTSGSNLGRSFVKAEEKKEEKVKEEKVKDPSNEAKRKVSSKKSEEPRCGVKTRVHFQLVELSVKGRVGLCQESGQLIHCHLQTTHLWVEHLSETLSQHHMG